MGDIQATRSGIQATRSGMFCNFFPIFWVDCPNLGFFRFWLLENLYVIPSNKTAHQFEIRTRKQLLTLKPNRAKYKN